MQPWRRRAAPDDPDGSRGGAEPPRVSCAAASRPIIASSLGSLTPHRRSGRCGGSRPLPAPAWTGARDATRPGLRCVQDAATDLDPGRESGEDCLNLSVWTPPPSDELRPVLVWIHGGGFANGSGDVYNARRLASRGDIVVVTINYRLGALGIPRSSRARPAGSRRQLRAGRPTGRAAVGPRQHRQLRR